MVSIKRALKSEQTLLKYYSLKINRLRDTGGKHCQTRGRVSFLLAMITKNILLLTLLLLISSYYFIILLF